MKRILTILFLFGLILNSFGQIGEFNDVIVNDELTVRDSTLIEIIEAQTSGATIDGQNGVYKDGNFFELGTNPLIKNTDLPGGLYNFNLGTVGNKINTLTLNGQNVTINSDNSIVLTASGVACEWDGSLLVCGTDTIATLADVRSEIASSLPQLPFNFDYTLSASTVDSRPGAGVFRLNNAVLANVTFIYIDYFDSDNISQSVFLSAPDTGSYISIKTDVNNYALYQLTGALTDAGNYFKYRVTYLGHNGVIAGASTIDLELSNNVGGTGGGGSFDGNRLDTLGINDSIYIVNAWVDGVESSAKLQIDTMEYNVAIVQGDTIDAGLIDLKTAVEAESFDEITTVLLYADTVMKYITEETKVGDEGIVVIGELKVDGFETVLGGGDSYTDGLVVWQTPDDVTYTDRTEAAKDLGNPFPSFGGTATGQTIYYGSDEPWTGFKLITETLVNPGTGAVSRMYWNGSGWIDFSLMAIDSEYPYTQRADNIGSVVGDEQVWFGDVDDIALTTINGVEKYYVKFEITSPITADGTTEQVKIHSDRFEIESDGNTFYYGRSIYKKPLIVHLTTTAEIDGLSPKDGTVDYTTTYSLKQKKNLLEDGVLDGSGGIITISEGLLTARDLEFTINYKVDAASAGDVEFEFEATQFEIGDVVDGTTAPDQQLSEIETIGTSEDDIIKQVSFNLDVETLLPGEFVQYVYFRDASVGNPNDTYGDDVTIISFIVTGWFYKP